MGIIVMWKMTDNQLILSFGSTINQPAEPHGENERRKLDSCGQVTHTPTEWCGSCLQAVPQKGEGGLFLTKPDSSNGRGGDPLPLPTAWTTEGPKPRIWKPNPSAESGIFTVLGTREGRVGKMIQDDLLFGSAFTNIHTWMRVDMKI